MHARVLHLVLSFTRSARVDMVRDVAGFFEKEVPMVLHNLLAGSLTMLFVYDRDAGFIAMAVLLPMGGVNAWTGGARCA